MLSLVLILILVLVLNSAAVFGVTVFFLFSPRLLHIEFIIKSKDAISTSQVGDVALTGVVGGYSRG